VSATELNDFAAIAEAVRTACIDTAIEAYEDAGIQGLCDEGRWEYTIAAMRRLDLQSLKDAAQTVPRLKPHREHP
jgi:hypothetical protein